MQVWFNYNFINFNYKIFFSYIIFFISGWYSSKLVADHIITSDKLLVESFPPKIILNNIWLSKVFIFKHRLLRSNLLAKFEKCNIPCGWFAS